MHACVTSVHDKLLSGQVSKFAAMSVLLYTGVVASMIPATADIHICILSLKV